MDDLISRQEVIDVLEKTFERYRMAWSPNKEEDYGGFASAVPKAINDIPTAYDVDKVVEEIQQRMEYVKGATKYGNKNAEEMHNSYSTVMLYEVADDVEDIIDIVRKGGVNEID